MFLAMPRERKKCYASCCAIYFKMRGEGGGTLYLYTYLFHDIELQINSRQNITILYQDRTRCITLYHHLSWVAGRFFHLLQLPPPPSHNSFFCTTQILSPVFILLELTFWSISKFHKCILLSIIFLLVSLGKKSPHEKQTKKSLLFLLSITN